MQIFHSREQCIEGCSELYFTQPYGTVLRSAGNRRTGLSAPDSRLDFQLHRRIQLSFASAVTFSKTLAALLLVYRFFKSKCMTVEAATLTNSAVPWLCPKSPKTNMRQYRSFME